MSVMALTKYEAACAALQAAKATDEVLCMRDKAEAMRAYAHQAKNKELEIDAAEIRLRAERRLGELISEQKRTVGLNPGTRTSGGGVGAGGSMMAPPAIPTLSDVGIDKKLSSRARKLAAIPEPEFEGMLGDWREKVAQEGERVTTRLLNAGEKHQRDAANVTEPASGEYTLVYADPPWEYGFAQSKSREIENNYLSATTDQICAHAPYTSENCVLLLWATAPKLPDALRVLSAWGFEYKTHAVWDKQKIGMGYWFRGQHELLLVGTKGNVSPPAPESRVSSLFTEARRAHSEKPDCVYQWIESAFPAHSKLEMYARIVRPGWNVWGNEVEAA